MFVAHKDIDTVEIALNGHWFERPLEACGHFSMYSYCI